MKKRDRKQGGHLAQKCSIGGQAVIEGVMMRGKSAMATAVRTSSGEITVESSRHKSAKEKGFFFRAPFFRGIFNFAAQMFSGTALLMRSAEVFGDFVEPSKFDVWFEKKFKTNSLNLVIAISVILGIAFAIGLFVFLPNLLAGLFFSIPAFSGAHPVLYSLTEGLLMIVIFVLYIVIVSAMKDIRRVFMYHGAEHRVINCFESGQELSVENVQKMSSAHARCGTTFMFIVLVVSILFFSLINWALNALGLVTDNAVLNSLIKLPAKIIFVPFVAGVSYELLMLFAKHDNWFTRAVRAPGMLLQKLTTRAPEDSMVECAIAAFQEVIALEADESRPTKKFDLSVPYALARAKIERLVQADKSDIDWLFVEVTKKNRSQLPLLKSINAEEFGKIEEIAKRMKKGAPLQYALGYTRFFGLKINVGPAVLIPRMETEQLVDEPLKFVGSEEKKVLELFCGSGAVALAIAANSKAKVVAADISNDAIEIARQNAFELNLDVEFAVSDVFSNIKEKYNLIVCNPPYIKSGDIEKLDKKVSAFEPIIALDGGEDGLEFYKRIRDKFENYLEKDGALLLEIGATQAKAVSQIFDGFAIKVVSDVEGNDRIVKVKKNNDT